MPKAGKVVTATIPGKLSHFSARSAVIYLPPAALVSDPPVLPVLIMMSGQPGTPFDQFTSGHINQYMDSYAAAHKGLAPIVISPDQLGAANNNPMCVNSPLGNSATYITVDVVNWIRSHLRVGTDRSAWAVGGFSQGATCATQFVSGYPKLFGSTLSISSELVPSNGTNANTLQQAFGGSQAAWEATWPVNLMKKNAPFTDTIASFVVGQNDTGYRAYAVTLSQAAAQAGMDTKLYISPGTTHDWYTVMYGYKMGFPRIAAHMGIG
jgi:S-formylglutathione hydrolase FrmB